MLLRVVPGASEIAAGRVTVDAIAAVITEAYAIAEVDLWRTRHVRTTASEVSTRLDRDGVLVAFDDGRLVGSVFTELLDVGCGWLGGLGVDPTYDGRGCGAALLDACEARAVAAGATEMQLEVLAPQPPLPHTDRLWQWYHRRGFREVERQSLAAADPELADDLARECDLVVLRHHF